MTQTGPPMDWNQCYETGTLPWDSGEVDENLVESLKKLGINSGESLEIGCGTGTNAIALARHGFTSVIATDLSPKAIELARAKAAAAGVKQIEFKVHDIIATAPAAAESVDFVFDRGVFHSVSAEQRPTFARRVADALKPGGAWVTLCGNADDKTELGPPRLTAAHIAAVVEPLFEVHELSHSQFRTIKDKSVPAFQCWRVILRKRP